MQDDQQPETKATDDANDNGQPVTSQATDNKLKLIGDVQHDYDTDAVLQFIDNVFDTTIPSGAHRLVFASKSNVPSKPLSGVSALEKVMQRTTSPRALYYSLSTCYPDKDGKLSHGSANFAGLHGVIFDDVGTKIDPANIPPELEPTYIIESSAGNYQWGFIFDQPITDVTQAMAVINTVAAAGLTDAGGKVPVKLVRLPEGVNGKQNSEKQTFKVNLNKWNGSVYTPEQLLDRINLDDGTGIVTWDRIQNGYDPLDKKHNTQYLPRAPIAQSTEGMIDEVMEWLHEHDMVLTNTGDGWVDIVCPWHHEHSDGEVSAGYNPLGQGDDPLTRGFNCFHDHCKDKDTSDFLIHVINSSDIPFLARRVTEWIPHGEYAYNEATDKVIRLTDTPVENNFGSFKRSHSRGSVFAVDGTGKNIKLNPVEAWMASPYRITISGIASNPREPMIFHDGNGTWFNTSRLPDWGTGGYDQAHVDKFLGFINYLIPDASECGYVLDWLTCKMVDPTFRGTGLVMVTPVFGAGRSTFANMVEQMLGQHNAARVPFTDLVNSTFNYWEDKLLVTVDETRDTAASQNDLYKTYEVIKQRVDTTNANTTMNVKYGGLRPVYACSSFLILSNHTDAIAIPREDRRLTVISNTDKPESGAYFNDLKAWIDDGAWIPHVFRYLQSRTVTHNTNIPLKTLGKEVMASSNLSSVSAIIAKASAYCEANGIGIISTPDLKRIVEDVLAIQHNDQDYRETYVRRCLNEAAKPFEGLVIRKKGGKVQRVRAFNWAIVNGTIPSYGPNMWRDKTSDIPQELKDYAQDCVDGMDCKAVVDYVVGAME